VTLGDIATRWRALSTVGGVGASLVTAMVHEPPAGDPKTIVAFGAFIAAVVSGLTYVAMRRWSTKKHCLPWATVAMVMLASFYFCNKHYDDLWDHYLGWYQGKPMIVGNVLTPIATSWVARTGHADPNQLLFDAGGDVSMFWTADSVRQVRSSFRQTYYTCYPLLALCLMATVQAVAVSELVRRRARVQPMSSVRQ
jgi:hypothetical protein